MLSLDLMELADLVRPEQLVDAILVQNPDLPLPVPVEALATLAGITQIQPLTSTGFEGTLIANAEKSVGAIFYNGTVPRSRQRFTIGHELGHFLLPWHRQTTFECTKEDISGRARKDWEIQANQFSAELLLPKALVKKQLLPLRDPEIAHVLKLSETFGTSVEATARRVVDLNEYPCAVVFSHNNEVRYTVVSEYFGEQLCVRKGDKLPLKSPSKNVTSDPDEWHEMVSTWWVKERKGDDAPESVYEQTLCQDLGFKMTLLTLG